MAHAVARVYLQRRALRRRAAGGGATAGAHHACEVRVPWWGGSDECKARPVASGVSWWSWLIVVA